MIAPLPDLLIEPVVRAALVEDLGRAGDVTADDVFPDSQALLDYSLHRLLWSWYKRDGEARAKDQSL